MAGALAGVGAVAQGIGALFGGLRRSDGDRGLDESMGTRPGAAGRVLRRAHDFVVVRRRLLMAAALMVKW